MLAAIIVLGSAVRLLIGVATHGDRFDMESYGIVATATSNGDLFSAYAEINGGEVARWPYPPGFWPVVAAAHWLEGRTGISLATLIHVPLVAADATLALLVWGFLARRGAGRARRLAGAALVALGPGFGVVSGYHGHFDAVAILPAVAALVIWEGRASQRRASTAGALVGLGAALKTVPIVMLIALLPSLRSRRQALTVTISALAVPLLLLAPFALTTIDGLGPVVEYEGVGGLGGLSLVAQPNLAALYVQGADVGISPLTEALLDYGSVLTAAALLLLAALLLRWRTPAVQAAVLVWLAVYVFGYTFAFHYFVWGLPFFIMAGYLRAALFLQLALLLPLVIQYTGPHGPAYTIAYVALMVGVWLALLIALGRLVGRARDEARGSLAPAKA